MYTIPMMGGGTNMLEDKVRDVFFDMVVLKKSRKDRVLFQFKLAFIYA